MNIQYVRLDDRVCETLNRMAMEQRRTVSEVVNDILSARLSQQDGVAPVQGVASGQKAG